LDGFATLIAATKLPEKNDDTYFAPCAYEIDKLSRLKGEVFGPILHIIRFDNLEKTVNEINATGYGLTFGFHSRLTERHKMVASSVRAGNIYINRNMIGAVVGVQPFGGQGLSGTGPKAGGPHYLHRFATEITVTDNIMATGGNIDLLATLEE
jgi:RHH-type proline utilization regulon transcriptional repressor/proline dehydrogenase/delta 1-pyrroline-5-carboxylate dehydrogenase